jgi:hypothetical protein
VTGAEREGSNLTAGVMAGGVKNGIIQLKSAMWLRRKFGLNEVKPVFTHLSSNIHG